MQNASIPFPILTQQKDARQKRDKTDNQSLCPYFPEAGSKQEKEGKKKRRLHHPVICFALTSTQGVSSLPHSSTKSCHPAVPTITTAFFPMLFNFPFGTRPCVSHPTGLYLKASQRVEVGKAAACIPTAMTLPITLPQNSPGSCSTAGRLPAEPQSAT